MCSTEAQRRHWDPLELELQRVMGLCVVLGIELRSFGRAVSS